MAPHLGASARLFDSNLILLHVRPIRLVSLFGVSFFFLWWGVFQLSTEHNRVSMMNQSFNWSVVVNDRFLL
jgi:hypothetical protein